MEFGLNDLVREDILLKDPTKGVTVYRGRIPTPPYLVVIKELTLSCTTEANVLMNEAYAMRALHHPNVLKLLGVFFKASSSQVSCLVLVSKFCERGDLHSEILRRAQARNYWKESELFSHFSVLVGTFAYLQDCGVAHRDIKPGNIFVDTDEQGQDLLLVGDFGECKRTQLQVGTLAGTPGFLSPLLRTAYRQAVQTGVLPQVKHNIFKSDVYSLGLTFLLMLFPDFTLEKPSETAMLAQLRATPYRWAAALIDRMLAEREEERLDFLQLRRFIETVSLNASQYGSELVPTAQAAAGSIGW